MPVKAFGLGNQRRAKRIVPVLGLAALLAVAVIVALSASQASAVSRANTRTDLPKTFALTGAVTGTPSSTATPNPCAPGWTIVSSADPGGYNNEFKGVAVASANDIWAVGEYNDGGGVPAYRTLIEHWDGSAWSAVPSPNVGDSNNYLNAVTVVSANDVWAVGYYHFPANFRFETLVLHWDGTSWSVVTSPNVGTGGNSLNALAVVAPDDIWAVGEYNNSGTTSRTLAVHWDGTSWSAVTTPTPVISSNSLSGVAAVSANDVWAVGGYYDESTGTSQTLVEHWDGTSWSIVPSPSGPSGSGLADVAALAANDVWAVGSVYITDGPLQTLVEHWDGTSWSIVPSPNTGTADNNFYRIAAVSANDMWAVGTFFIPGHVSQTLVEHWDGTSWSVVTSPNPSPSTNYFYAVDATSPNDVWAVGYLAQPPNYAAETLVERYISPCVTPTVTPTPAGIINGHLTWDGITQPDARNAQVSGTLALCSASVPVTYAFTTDSSGNFTVTTGLPDGAYNWYTKGGRHISNSSPTDGGSVVITGGHASQEFGEQRAGDTNGDNLVNSVDFIAVKTQFQIPGGQHSADFDYDQLVDVADFNILKRNFGLQSHALACP